MQEEEPSWRLVRRAPQDAGPPRLDAAQRAVVEHPGGPLLVLAGPGTGKTTTIVEAVAARIARGEDPDRVLVLTFSRRAAGQLRERISARLGGTVREPLARTFHSYAFGLLRREAALRGEPAPRLLSGAEQDLVIRDLLRGDVEHDDAVPVGGPRRWPAALRPALLTRGFAQELRDFLLRCYERGIDADLLESEGARCGREDWQAAGRFLTQYAAVTALGQTGAYDPAELLRSVLALWQDEPELLERERSERAFVLVDELQDTDPVQVELLQGLAGGGRDLVVVGDPDQSIYAFRGADAGAIRRFPREFPTRWGEPAPTLALTTCRRSGPELLVASRWVASRLPGPRAHRDLHAAGDVSSRPAEAHVLRSQSQEAAYVASRLREAHLLEGVPWSQMAVLVRSTAGTLPLLRRALAAAGVPVGTLPEELRLVEQPAVAPLLLLLRAALDPAALDVPAAETLLTSALGGLDPLGLRRLRRELRRLELAAGGARGSGELLVAALREPADLVTLPEPVRRPAARLAGLLGAATASAAAGGSAEDVLWAAWSRSGLSQRWQRHSLAGGARGAAADRDLDAVVSLFEAAARFVDRLPAAGPLVFLDHLLGQEIPADSLAPRAPSGEAVQILTAHASKGLEWDLVAVAGVQEGSWPDLRLRGSFLGVERLLAATEAGAGQPPGGPDRGTPAADPLSAAAELRRLLEEERRLFYVAVTRARRTLLVTAAANEREGLQPSRFLEELDLLPHEATEGTAAAEQPRVPTEVPRALSLPALVGELRAVLLDPDPARAPLRVPAARQLARLAAAGVRGADPAEWYGLPALSDEQPLVEADALVPVSPSKVEAFTSCRLRWFLEHVGGTDGQRASQSIGNLVHAVAAGAGDPAQATEAALLERLEQLLAGTDLGRGWHARRQQERARAMVRRLASWLAQNSRELVATELEFEAVVGRARLRGRVDRLERDADGRAVVVDLKTGSSKPRKHDLAQHPQLGTYQVAVERGGFAALGPAVPGGGELVQLGVAGGRDGCVQPQPALGTSEDPAWAARLLESVAEGMAGSAFLAMASSACRSCPVQASCPTCDGGRQVGM